MYSTGAFICWSIYLLNIIIVVIDQRSIYPCNWQIYFSRKEHICHKYFRYIKYEPIYLNCCWGSRLITWWFKIRSKNQQHCINWVYMYTLRVGIKIRYLKYIKLKAPLLAFSTLLCLHRKRFCYRIPEIKMQFFPQDSNVNVPNLLNAPNSVSVFIEWSQCSQSWP